MEQCEVSRENKVVLYHIDPTLEGTLFVYPGLQLQPFPKKAQEWVNPSKRGGMNGVFQGLAGLLRGISRGRSPREIPRSILFKIENFCDNFYLKKSEISPKCPILNRM